MYNTTWDSPSRTYLCTCQPNWLCIETSGQDREGEGQEEGRDRDTGEAHAGDKVASIGACMRRQTLGGPWGRTVQVAV